MAVQTLSKSPDLLRFNLPTANLATEVQLEAKNSSDVTVLFEGDPGKFALVGTDGQILATADQTNVGADRYFTFHLGRNQATVSIFVQPDVNDTDCVVIVEPS